MAWLCKLAQFEQWLAKRMCTREAEDHRNGVVVDRVSF